MHGLHLNERGASKLGLTQTSVVFEGQATTQDLKNLRQFMFYCTI